jgi:predicted AlkP superfamily phosphohydrolase/phosphomutase
VIALESGAVFLATASGIKKSLPIADIGIEFLKRDPGTGYHQPRGALILYGNGIAANDARNEVDSTDVRPAILQMMGVA